VVPARALAESPTTQVKQGTRRADQAVSGYKGLHVGSWGYEVYFNHLAEYEDAWGLLVRAAQE
jgi:hypothetical protein